MSAGEDYPTEQQDQRPPEAYANGAHGDYGLDEVSDDVCPECGHAHPRMDVFEVPGLGELVLCLAINPQGQMRFMSGLHPFDTVKVLQQVIDSQVDPEKPIEVHL